MVSKAFKILSENKDTGLTNFKDKKVISDWVNLETFKPNKYLTRAEALTLLKRLFINGMGL